MSYKQVILVRMDLKMPKGKLAAQCAHASVEAVLGLSSEKLKAWQKEGMKKIVLKVSSKKELIQYIQKARAYKIKTSLITDAGKTFFSTATMTCGAIGPDTEERIDKITSELAML